MTYTYACDKQLKSAHHFEMFVVRKLDYYVTLMKNVHHVVCKFKYYKMEKYANHTGSIKKEIIVKV